MTKKLSTLMTLPLALFMGATVGVASCGPTGGGSSSSSSSSSSSGGRASSGYASSSGGSSGTSGTTSSGSSGTTSSGSSGTSGTTSSGSSGTSGTTSSGSSGTSGTTSSGGTGNGQGQWCDNSNPCPADVDCLAMQGWTRGFCSADCTAANASTACAYGSAGGGECLFITEQGGTAADHCGVLCGGGGACPTDFQCDTSQGAPGVCMPVQPGSTSSSSGGSTSSSGGTGNGQGQWCDNGHPCPTNVDCLAMQGWTRGFCSADCTTANASTACAYDSAGGGQCIFITTQGGTVADHCGVVCGGSGECPADFQCDTSQGAPGVCMPVQP